MNTHHIYGERVGHQYERVGTLPGTVNIDSSVLSEEDEVKLLDAVANKPGTYIIVVQQDHGGDPMPQFLYRMVVEVPTRRGTVSVSARKREPF